jgi:hypothetical protein
MDPQSGKHLPERAIWLLAAGNLRNREELAWNPQNIQEQLVPATALARS